MSTSKRQGKEFVQRHQQYRRSLEATKNTHSINISHQVSYDNFNEPSHDKFNVISHDDVQANIKLPVNEASNKDQNVENIVSPDIQYIYDDVNISSSFDNEQLHNSCEIDLDNEQLHHLFETNITDESYNESSLKDALAKWVVERHISHIALLDLLHILALHHPELPTLREKK